MSNIKNNNFRRIDCRLIDDEYMDFMLSKDGNIKEDFDESICCISKLEFNKQNDTVVSEISWPEAKTSSRQLKNIGLTGVDNGFISYEKDRIGNDEFLSLFTGSTFDLSTYQDKFFMKKVSGNTLAFQYPIEHHEDYSALKGGFYQGFFKSGDDYQTLPNRIEDEWNFTISLRRRDYDTPINTINNRHPENNGMVFYIGTRAENKFWELYKSDEAVQQFHNEDGDNYTSDYDITSSEVIKHQYHEDIPNMKDRDDEYNKPCECGDYFKDAYNPYETELPTKPRPSACGCPSKPIDLKLGSYDFNEHNSCGQDPCGESKPTCKNEKYDNYFSDEYTGKDATLCECPDSGLAIHDEYMQEQIDLSKVELKDSAGHKADIKGYYEIETDNKFIIMNRTKEGFTKDTWKEDKYKFVLTGITNGPTVNYFPYLNRTTTGYTFQDIKQLEAKYEYAYDVFNDIKNNAFGVKINEDGSISYRYLISDCESENKFTTIEETSAPNLIKLDEWATLHIKMVRMTGNGYDSCQKDTKEDKMKLYIYVNGFLKLISKELPMLRLHGLNDVNEKQEGVAYNISVGGGTQGLMERIMLDYYEMPEFVLPLERDFGGSFIGDIKSFAFNACPMTHNAILSLSDGLLMK